MSLNHGSTELAEVHTLSDFRTDHADALDELFTQVIALLVEKGLVKVSRISQPALSLPKGTARGCGRAPGRAVSAARSG